VLGHDEASFGDAVDENRCLFHSMGSCVSGLNFGCILISGDSDDVVRIDENGPPRPVRLYFSSQVRLAQSRPPVTSRSSDEV
jgi:hypothetical protein